jgi:hypothetical protein
MGVCVCVCVMLTSRCKCEAFLNLCTQRTYVFNMMFKINRLYKSSDSVLLMETRCVVCELDF